MPAEREVEILPDPVCKAKGKIQATKRWLSRAEEHFDRDAPVRGQLDLLLAEAELRSTRETLQTRSVLAKKWVQQGMALGLAAVVAAAGAGGLWWWLNVAPEAAVAPQRIATPAIPVISAPVQNISAAPVQKTETPPAATVESTISQQEVKKSDKAPDRDPVVSRDEMKRLIQSAGQTLRGQTKQ